MAQDRSSRVYQTLKDVEMFVLGAVRVIPEVKVSYTLNAKGGTDMNISFQEYNRIADDVHRMLRNKRRVYHERD